MSNGMLYDPPEGFTLDPDSGLYYRSEFDAAGTQWVTWFDAMSGSYEEMSYPPAQAVPAEEPPVMPVIWDGPVDNASDIKKKSAVLKIVLPIVLLVAVAAGAFIYFDVLSYFRDDSSAAPEDIGLIAYEAGNAPAVLSFDDVNFGISSGHHGADEYTEDAMNPIEVLFDNSMEYIAGEMFFVSVTNVSQAMIDARAFISVYEIGAPHSAYQEWYYLNQNVNDFWFMVPERAGDYELRIFDNEYQYTDETMIYSIYFTVVPPAMVGPVSLNMDLMGLLGMSNSYLRSVNGYIGHAGIWNDVVIADYSEYIVTYPLRFNLFGDHDAINQTLDAVATGELDYGTNYWPDDFVVISIIAEEAPYFSNMNYLFHSEVSLTLDNLLSSFYVDGGVDFVPAEEQNEYQMGTDYYTCVFVIDGYRIRAFFEEQYNDSTLFYAIAWIDGY